jgi:hypothetical protein
MMNKIDTEFEIFLFYNFLVNSIRNRERIAFISRSMDPDVPMLFCKSQDLVLLILS